MHELKVDSVHEFPRLQSDLMLKNVIVSQSYEQSNLILKNVVVSQSHEVAIDNQQISSNSKSNSKRKALGGKGESKSRDKIESRCNVSEISVVGHVVESCIASSGNGKAIGDSSISNGV